MKAGKVLVAQGPKVGKSMMDLMMFIEQVRSEGLHSYADDLGRIWLGLKENFPQSVLDRQEQEQHLRDLLIGR